MGAPAMRWREADGGERLAYPRGPAGFHTYMVETDKKWGIQATGKRP